MDINSVIWDDNPGEVSGSTPFGYYDSDTIFTQDAKKVSKWICRRLGYPIQDVELTDTILYSNFEESINKFASMVNNHSAVDNFLLLKGSPTSSNPYAMVNNINNIIKIADSYGTAVGVGGHVNYYSASLNVTSNVQTYDLKSLFSSSVTIRKVFHNPIPSIIRNYDFYTGNGNDVVNSIAFGFNSYTQGSQIYLLRPVYEDILRMQAVELNDQIRKANYSFKIVNNVLKLFPRPMSDFKLWFEYTIDSEVYSYNESTTGKINNISDTPFNLLTYSNINSAGKQWIFEYCLAISKITLGTIRGKFQNIPLPDGSVSLDADSLRASGEAERDALIEQLKDNLEKVSKKSQLENKKDESEMLQGVLQKVPLPIFVI